MTLRFLQTVLFANLTALSLSPAFAEDTIVDQTEIQTAITIAIVPAVLSFEKDAVKLHETLVHGCESEQVKNAFVQSVKSFSDIEYLRLGPMNQENRAERLFFWPDRKGIGERQLRRLLAAPDIETLDATTLAQKSVALQGLAALERILFSPTPPTDTACLLSRSIATNIARISNELVEGWTSPDGIAERLTYPASDKTYRTYEESLAALLTLATNALDSIGERKLDLLITGLSKESAIPRTAPFYRSNQTLANIRNNISSAERLLVDSGIISGVDKQTADQLQFETRTIFTMLDAANDALEEHDSETAIRRLKAVQNILTNYQAIVKDSVTKHYRVSTGFNSSDGD